MKEFANTSAIFEAPKKRAKIETSGKLDVISLFKDNPFLHILAMFEAQPMPRCPGAAVKSLQGPLRLSQQFHPFPCFRLRWEVHTWKSSPLFFDFGGLMFKQWFNGGLMVVSWDFMGFYGIYPLVNKHD